MKWDEAQTSLSGLTREQAQNRIEQINLLMRDHGGASHLDKDRGFVVTLSGIPTMLMTGAGTGAGKGMTYTLSRHQVHPVVPGIWEVALEERYYYHNLGLAMSMYAQCIKEQA